MTDNFNENIGNSSISNEVAVTEKPENKRHYKCNNCGEIFEGKLDTCPGCGRKLKWADVPFIEEAVKAQSVPFTKAQKIMSIVLNGIMIAAFVALFCFLFAPFIEGTDLYRDLIIAAAGSGYSFSIPTLTYGAEFWFRDALCTSERASVYGFAFFTYIAAMIATFVAGLIGIIRCAMNIKHSENKAPIVPFAISAAVALSYFAIAFSSLYPSVESAEFIKPGWGFVATVVFVCLGVAANAAFSIVRNYKDSSKLTGSILRLVTFVILIIAGTTCLKEGFILTQSSSSYTMKEYFSFMSIMALKEEASAGFGEDFAIVLSVLLMYLTLITTFMSAIFAGCNKRKGALITSIITFGSVIVTMLFALIPAQIIEEKIYAPSSSEKSSFLIGGGFAICTILSLAAMIFSIIASGYKDDSINN